MRALHRIVWLVFWLAAPGRGAAQSLTLTFFNVGQADAALVETPEGRHILIDAGGPSGVVPSLARFDIDTLDLVIASHAHSDHIGGMPAVLAAYPVRFYLDNGIPHTTATYQRTMGALQINGARYLRAEPRTITVGSAAVRILSQPTIERNTTEQNNHSVGVMIEFGEFRALFTGDSETRELSWWLAHDSFPPRVHVVKVAHHGATNGTTVGWIQGTQALAAIISVGRGNSYGHPSAQIIQAWTAAGAQVYRTDQVGTITIRADRNGEFTVNHEQ